MLAFTGESGKPRGEVYARYSSGQQLPQTPIQYVVSDDLQSTQASLVLTGNRLGFAAYSTNPSGTYRRLSVP
jgi:hypothetical protein